MSTYKNKQFDASYKTYTERMAQTHQTRYYYSEHFDYIYAGNGSTTFPIFNKVSMTRCARYDNDRTNEPPQVIDFHSRHTELVKQLIAERMSFDDIMGYIDL